MPATSTWVAHGAFHAGASFAKPLTSSWEILTNSNWPIGIPDVHQLAELYNRGWISKETIGKFARANGAYIDYTGTYAGAITLFGSDAHIKDVWHAWVSAQEEIPTAHEMLTLTNRGIMPDDKLLFNLGRQGFKTESVANAFANLRWEIPGSSDLVRFSVRHVFEPDLIKYLGYNDEFRPVLDVWHKFQGLNYPIFSGPFKQSINTWEVQHGFPKDTFLQQYIDQDLPDPTWAQAFWWSHWVLPSPSQGYEMYFRLRPDRDRTFDPPFAKDLNFTLADLNLLLRANDYPPFYRGALAAIAHRIPGIRFMRELLRSGVYGPQQVYGLLLRQGYSEGDAGSLVNALAKTDRDTRRAKIETQARSQLAKYWELGIITQGQYRDLLIQHGMLPDEADETVSLADTDRLFHRAQGVVNYVHKQFAKGAMSADQALDNLHAAGIVEPQAHDYIGVWSIEIKGGHKEVAAAKAQQLACKGLISLDDLTVRLGNLGYAVDDVRALSAEAVQCNAERTARIAAQAARAQRQSERELIAAQRAAARVITQNRKALAGKASPAKLRKWYCEGLVGAAEVHQRLSYLDWSDVDITRLLADCSASGGGTGGGSGGPRGPTSPGG